MAIVLDAAREDKIESAASMRYMQFFAGTVETHITARGDLTPWAGINNTLDAWVPHVATGSDAAAP